MIDCVVPCFPTAETLSLALGINSNLITISSTCVRLRFNWNRCTRYYLAVIVVHFAHSQDDGSGVCTVQVSVANAAGLLTSFVEAAIQDAVQRNATDGTVAKGSSVRVTGESQQLIYSCD